MSRSLSTRLRIKAGNRNAGPEGQGAQMFRGGKPCPPNDPDKGKAHAMWKGWKRAEQASRKHGIGGQP